MLSYDTLVEIIGSERICEIQIFSMCVYFLCQHTQSRTIDIGANNSRGPYRTRIGISFSFFFSKQYKSNNNNRGRERAVAHAASPVEGLGAYDTAKPLSKRQIRHRSLLVTGHRGAVYRAELLGQHRRRRCNNAGAVQRAEHICHVGKWPRVVPTRIVRALIILKVCTRRPAAALGGPVRRRKPL